MESPFSVVVLDVVAANLLQFYILQNHWAKFNQTLIQSILGWRGFNFVQMEDHVLTSQVVIKKNIDDIWKYIFDKTSGSMSIQISKTKNKKTKKNIICEMKDHATFLGEPNNKNTC